jgi:diacylglycerol O-acyltransferase
MPNPFTDQHLSCVDAFFLYLEQPGTPLNVASVSVFEGKITLAECRQHINSKLGLMPRFLQRVIPAPLGLGLPAWEVDPDFAIEDHVREISLARGGENEFKNAVSKLLSATFDRRRPLWDITLIHGLKGHRTGVLIRAHHCLMDGVAGVGMLKTLLDETPTASRRARRIPAPPAAKPRDFAALLLEGVTTSYCTAARALLNAQTEVLRMLEDFAAPKRQNPAGDAPAPGEAREISGLTRAFGGLSQTAEVARALSELARPVDRLPYNTLCRGPQKFEWLEIPMDDVLAVKRACAATVNDVVLATVTATLRRYAGLHGQPVKRRNLRLVAPVNLRDTREAYDTGNHITFLPVDIPMGVRAPKALLSAVQQSVRAARSAHASELVGLVMTLLDAFPPAFQELIGSVLSQLPISLCNSICTNVHGPSTPLYLMGHKMLASYPYVPIGGEIGMNCAVLSYNGVLCVGFTGDAQSIPDLHHLPIFFRESFDELKEAAGVVRRQKAARIKKPRNANEKPEAEAPSIVDVPKVPASTVGMVA